MSAEGISQFQMWNGGCLFIGFDASPVPLHAHHAMQIALGNERPVGLRDGSGEGWTEYQGAIVPSHRPHAFDPSGRSAAVILVEPETVEGRALAELYGTEGISALPTDKLKPVAAALWSAWRARAGPEQMVAVTRRVVSEMAAGVQPRAVVDERILRAIEYIWKHLDRPLTLEEVSGVANLSPGRFRHLFVEQTGMALRPYILWVRIIRAWQEASETRSLSAAAHRAGFADQAHLTRTCRRMFGIPPSALQFGT